MKSGRAKIGIFQKMRIKNLRGVSEVRLKNSTPSSWKRRKTIRNFLRNGRVRLNYKNSEYQSGLAKEIFSL